MRPLTSRSGIWRLQKNFYQDTLGQEVIVFKSGNSIINVYRSQYAGTNQATAITWVVGEGIEDVVLKAKGVAFEHYDMPGRKTKG
jgi:hypothetical protein